VVHPLWLGIEPEVVFGDLTDDAALASLTRGADVVINAAGLTKARSRAAFDAVNAAGAARVAARAGGAMIQVSSLAAREPQLSDYAASKRAGEDEARRILGDRLTIVRPPALYGPDDPETLPLFQAAATYPILPVLDANARIALMHVGDSARQIAALAAAPPGAALTLSDHRPGGYSWREIMETACSALGRPRPVLVRIPDAALVFAAAAGQATKRRGSTPMLSLGKVRELLHCDWSVSPGEQDISLPKPIFDLEMGFRDAIYGYQSRGVRFGMVNHLEKRTD
jgi:uncharacterized protein YbjT (DUF2867 family)